VPKRDSSSSVSSFTLDSNTIEDGAGVKIHPIGVKIASKNCGCSSSNECEEGSSGNGLIWDPMWAIEMVQAIFIDFLRQNRRLFCALLYIALILLYHIFLGIKLIKN
jgi:hypothetical protein